ncbi:MAG TPA: SsrA-binding protein SmpB [bacterium]|nr:SsrA-binding protein SmpB [bacterium]HPP86252.1 SsrA-binding protein SmpB [bacterium]
MKIILKNRKAFFDYEIIEKFEAGIELKGCEVKSLRAGKANFKDAYCEVRNYEIFLIGMRIEPYKEGSYNNPDSERDRKLLLHKSEIIKINNKINERGLSLIPLNIYLTAKQKIKLEIALAKGKRQYEKREKIKKEDLKLEIAYQTKIRKIKF